MELRMIYIFETKIPRSLEIIFLACSTLEKLSISGKSSRNKRGEKHLGSYFFLLLLPRYPDLQRAEREFSRMSALKP